MNHVSARSKTHLLTEWIAVEVSAHSAEGHSLAVDRCLVEEDVPGTVFVPQHLQWSGHQRIVVGRLLDTYSFNQTLDNGHLTAVHMLKNLLLSAA